MAIAASGTHFTGMVATVFEYHPHAISTQIPSMSGCFTSESVYSGALVAAMLFGLSLRVIFFAEQRACIEHLLADLNQHTKFVQFLKSDSRYTAYVNKWFPVFAKPKTLSFLCHEEEYSVTERVTRTFRKWKTFPVRSPPRTPRKIKVVPTNEKSIYSFTCVDKVIDQDDFDEVEEENEEQMYNEEDEITLV